MKKHLYNKILKCFFIIAIVSVSMSFAAFSASVLKIYEDDFVIGNNDAPVTIIEYASLSCSHCADFHIKTLPKLIEEYVDTGKVKIVFRYFPFNYPALLGSMVLHCVPNELRFEYSSALYKLQKKWVVRENKKSTQELFKIMQSGGMTKEKFNQCIKNTDLENNIQQRLIDAQNEFNIQSTPAFLINGLLIEGNKPIKNFREIIDNKLLE